MFGGLTGPTYRQLGTTFGKQVRLTEIYTLVLRMEAYNLTNSMGKSGHDAGVPDRAEKPMAVRKGRWKLHIDTVEGPAAAASSETGLPLLFNVQQDISERRNLAARQPDVVKDLLETIKRHQASFTPAPTRR